RLADRLRLGLQHADRQPDRIATPEAAARVAPLGPGHRGPATGRRGGQGDLKRRLGEAHSRSLAARRRVTEEPSRAVAARGTHLPIRAGALTISLATSKGDSDERVRPRSWGRATDGAPPARAREGEAR